MEIATKIISALCEAVPVIVALVALVAGVAARVKSFMALDAERKKEVFQEQADKVVDLIKSQLLSIVTKAEKEWGGGTGKIKKSWVWEQLAAQYTSLIQYVETGYISQTMIDALIEDAVSELEHLRETNNNVAALVDTTSASPEGGLYEICAEADKARKGE